MGFADSLHPLSIVDGIRAAAARTPGRIALVDGGEALTYAQLLAAAGRPHRSAVVQWLTAMLADAGADENRPAALARDGAAVVTLSHRELLLRALDRIVLHAAFDRDGVLALPLPFPSAVAFVAATLSLWLGSTLHVLQPGNLDALAEGIAQGRFDTCWLGAAEFAALEARREALPPPAAGFLLALFDGAPAAGVRARIVDWLGAARVAE